MGLKAGGAGWRRDAGLGEEEALILPTRRLEGGKDDGKRQHGGPM